MMCIMFWTLLTTEHCFPSETLSAADKDFGFNSSNLKEWVAEKYHHKDVPEVITISVENLRGKEAPETTANRIKDIRKDGKPPPVIPKTFTASDM